MLTMSVASSDGASNLCARLHGEGPPVVVQGMFLSYHRLLLLEAGQYHAFPLPAKNGPLHELLFHDESNEPLRPRNISDLALFRFIQLPNKLLNLSPYQQHAVFLTSMDSEQCVSQVFAYLPNETIRDRDTSNCKPVDASSPSSFILSRKFEGYHMVLTSGMQTGFKFKNNNNNSANIWYMVQEDDKFKVKDALSGGESNLFSRLPFGVILNHQVYAFEFAKRVVIMFDYFNQTSAGEYHSIRRTSFKDFFGCRPPKQKEREEDARIVGYIVAFVLLFLCCSIPVVFLMHKYGLRKPNEHQRPKRPKPSTSPRASFYGKLTTTTTTMRQSDQT